VRIFSRGGHDWAAQLPTIVAAMQALPVKSAVLDGEGVTCGTASHQLGAGSCRKTDGRMVAVPTEQCIAMAGTIEIPFDPRLVPPD
jgi:ATP-dependent DNA ligase